MSRFSFSQLLKPYRYLMIGTVVALCCFSVLGLALPWMLKIAIDKIIPNADYSLFALLCGGMFLLFSARAVCFYIASYLTTYTSMRSLIDIRQKLFKHLQSLSFSTRYLEGKGYTNNRKSKSLIF